MAKTDIHEKVSYVVGEERGVAEILRIDDVRPLLKGAVRAGAVEARLELADGLPVCAESAVTILRDPREILQPLYLEGEPVGSLIVAGHTDDATLDGIAAMLKAALDVVLNNNLKRMLTTEMHTSVVTATYDELLTKNEALTESEARYKELAESLDVKVRERTAELTKAQARLLQQEKLASVGQLAAGVAHEINNPMGFITSNLNTLEKYFLRFQAIIDWYSDSLRSGLSLEQLLEAESAKRRELKIEIIRKDLPDLLAQSLSGAERVKKIVADLKGFSHVDEAVGRDFILSEEIERALRVLSHQLPSDARIECQVPKLPRIRGDGAAFCQSLGNMIRNSCQAQPLGLELRFAAELSGDQVALTIEDNGPGIPEALRSKVFDPFFTTRAVGSGAGMGLAVVNEFVTGIGGTITVDESPTGGARFVMMLPLCNLSPASA